MKEEGLLKNPIICYIGRPEPDWIDRLFAELDEILDDIERRIN
jgi:hypothetical protein